MPLENPLPSAIRRAPYIFIRLRSTETIELRSLLQGDCQLLRSGILEIVEPFTGRARLTYPGELESLARVSDDEPVTIDRLLEEFGIEESRVGELVKMGVLTYDGDARWSRRNSLAWDSVASLFHVSCLYEAAELNVASAINIEEKITNADVDARHFIGRFGQPPPARLQYRSEETADHRAGTVGLPVDESPDDSFFKALSDRRTCRQFAELPLELSKLATLLRWSFGVQGIARLSDEYWVPLKSSPSGGGMHPVEAYPMVCDVRGLEPGVYHYDAFGHLLEPIRYVPRDALRGVVGRLASGQEFAGTAAVSILLVARLGRNFWKYPDRSRTYSVVLQDAGHLSQTFYLTAARLGLGAFYTAAISGLVTSAELGIDDSLDAPIGLCGCGYPDEFAARGIAVEGYIPGQSPPPGPVEVRAAAARVDPSDRQRRETFPGSEHFRGLSISPAFNKE